MKKRRRKSWGTVPSSWMRAADNWSPRFWCEMFASLERKGLKRTLANVMKEIGK